MLKDLLKQNRSYRGYDESVRLTREQLLDMVDCARYAPFSQNFQEFFSGYIFNLTDFGKIPGICVIVDRQLVSLVKDDISGLCGDLCIVCR